jgi:hypothetical protein
MHFFNNYTNPPKRAVLINGRSPVAGTSGTTIKNLNVLDNLINYSALSPTTVSVSSSNQVADIAAGTGARQVHIFGLGTDLNPLQETITLHATDGRIPVVGTKTFYTVFAAEVSAGSGRTNVGDIYVYTTGTAQTNGIPTALTTTWIRILPTLSSSESGFYVVPKGYEATISDLIIHTRSQIGIISVWTEYPGTAGVGSLEQVWQMGLPATTPVVQTKILRNYKFREGAYIYLRVTPGTTLAIATASMEIVLTKKS